MEQVRKGKAAASTRSSSTIPTASPSTSPPTAGRARGKTSRSMRRYAAVIALAAAWLAVAVDVLYGGPISNLDGWIAERVLLPRRSPVTLAVLFWTNLHSLVAISLYATVFALLLARRRAWDWVVGVALAVPGGMLLNAALKLAIQRSR